MKTDRAPFRVLALLPAGLLIFLAQAAQACEGCKSSMSENTAAVDAGVGFAASIYFMLGMPILLVSAIAWFAVKNIRQIEAARRIEAEQRTVGEATAG